jgi:DNA ligase-1
MLLAELAATSEAVRATSKRTEKIERLAEALRRMAPEEVEAGVAFLSGELRQRQIGVGWAALRDLPPTAGDATLTIGDAAEAFARIGATTGQGSQAARRDLLGALFAKATDRERAFLVALLLGDLRQGALAGVMTEAVARAAETPRDAVRRAVMLQGDLAAVAAIALAHGAPGLETIGLQVGRPIQPMLAAPGDDLDAALARINAPAAVEFKLDGARIQVHKAGDDVRVFSRSLDDVTARVPEVVEAARALPTPTAVLDGEAIALLPDGRPRPFQQTAARFASGAGPPLTPQFFDVLHADGDDLLDAPGDERFAALAALVPEPLRVPRATSDRAQDVLAEALARGHEGVMVKALDAPYAAGARGAGWLKVKPRHTLDLVVLAAEWGHGRRRGWLSNLHLGARAGDGFVMLGKTFKGLTDAMLTWQTEHLLTLEVARDGHVVVVQPDDDHRRVLSPDRS